VREPFRVAVWGPGRVGGACIRDIVALPETELVGVFAYSENKKGLDVGEAIGIDPVGIHVTVSRDEFLALDAEVVLFCPMDFGEFGNEPDLFALLESGKNVITMIPYHHPEDRGAEILARYEQACATGNSSFHVAGVDPNYVIDRLLPLATGMSNHIRQLRLQESAFVPFVPPGAMMILGFGTTLDEFDSFPMRTEYPAAYFEPGMRHIAAALGKPLERIERVRKCRITDHEIVLPQATIPAGTIGAVGHEWIGYSDGEPFFVGEVCWYMSEDMRADWAGDTEGAWIISIEGRPSAKITVEVMASIQQGLREYPGDPTPAAWYFTSVPMVQAIPAVIAAPPGILRTPMPNIHWKADMRA
jgi:2,4-diaminopentanoate dehydrogenase